MRKTLSLASFIPLLLMAACASTPDPYPRPGYYETRIEQDRYRVVFRPQSNVPRERADDLALLRAADLTVQNGYDWFRITSRDARAIQPKGPVISLGTGSANYGRRSSVGVGLGTSFQLGGGASALLTLEVQMGKGPTPEDRSAYDARDVIKTIGARL